MCFNHELLYDTTYPLIKSEKVDMDLSLQCLKNCLGILRWPTEVQCERQVHFTVVWRVQPCIADMHWKSSYSISVSLPHCNPI